MTREELEKKNAAFAALDYIDDDDVVGVGTGSTIQHFIDALATIKHKINAAVASSKATAKQLYNLGIPVIDLNVAGQLPIYVDGADEVNRFLQCIKGGGGALTREKILASAAKKFICIAGFAKQVTQLGTHPLPIEVISMARSYVAREIVKLGGEPVYREGFTTDNGHIILDIYNLNILEPIKLEQRLNNISGVVSNGLFAMRGADLLLLGAGDQVKVITNQVSQ